MKKFVIAWISAIGVVVGIGNGQPVFAANINDFTISDYQIEMTLGRDGESRSTLTTTETITAQFPNYDQNHGLVRAIPKSYDGHKTSVDVQSVTDANGVSRKYDTSTDGNDNLIVRMADMDKFVYGAQTYKLTYIQHDVTRFYQNTNADEFYWDTNGTEWKVPIEKLSVKVMLDEVLATKLTGQTACYQGEKGSTGRCELQQDKAMFSTQAQYLKPGENVTVAIGFQSGTFSPYVMTLSEKLFMWWGIAQGVLFAVGAAMMTWIGMRYYRIVNRSKELGTIVPEYLPPKQSVITAASLAKPYTVKGSIMTAQLIDLAVKHYLKIYETRGKKWYISGEYDIEITQDLTTLSSEEKEFLSDMFDGSLPRVGQRLKLKSLQNNMGYLKRTRDDDKHIKKLVRGEYALREEDLKLKKWLRLVSGVLLVLTMLGMSPIMLIITIVVFVMSFDTWRLTDKGLDLRRYLEGLSMYIKVAEEERIKMLQSPEGAEKVASVVKGSDIQESSKLVKLYERVLPYAVLFGQEKEWSKQLGDYYDKSGMQPDWYSGTTAFNAVAFSSGMSGLSQAASYASSSSSSSGGSGGGGSSGGGGGGGGGGGA